MEEWRDIGRPGPLGKRRDEKFQEWDNMYGQDNWRLMWKVGDRYVDFNGACELYEEAYYRFLNSNPEVVQQLIQDAANVYDDNPSNIESGFDYNKQETVRTHLQDIAIRCALKRLGVWFQGKKLIQIRHDRGEHELSMTLSPGKVPFHMPDIFDSSELEGWWDPGSVESLYQSFRVLQVKRPILQGMRGH